MNSDFIRIEWRNEHAKNADAWATSLAAAALQPGKHRKSAQILPLLYLRRGLALCFTFVRRSSSETRLGSALTRTSSCAQQQTPSGIAAEMNHLAPHCVLHLMVPAAQTPHCHFVRHRGRKVTSCEDAL